MQKALVRIAVVFVALGVLGSILTPVEGEPQAAPTAEPMPAVSVDEHDAPLVLDLNAGPFATPEPAPTPAPEHAPSPTPEPAPTPIPEPGTKPELPERVGDQQAVWDYSAEVYRIAGEMSNLLAGVVMTPDYMAGAARDGRAMIARAQVLHPPAGYGQTHALFVAALQANTDAFESAEGGLSRFDLTQMDRATALFEEGAQLSQRATAALPTQ